MTHLKIGEICRNFFQENLKSLPLIPKQIHKQSVRNHRYQGLWDQKYKKTVRKPNWLHNYLRNLRKELPVDLIQYLKDLTAILRDLIWLVEKLFQFLVWIVVFLYFLFNLLMPLVCGCFPGIDLLPKKEQH